MERRLLFDKLSDYQLFKYSEPWSKYVCKAKRSICA